MARKHTPGAEAAVGRYVLGELAAGRDPCRGREQTPVFAPSQGVATARVTSSMLTADGMRPDKLLLTECPGLARALRGRPFPDQVEEVSLAISGMTLPTLEMWLSFLECVPTLWWVDPKLWDGSLSMRAILELLCIAGRMGNRPLVELLSRMDQFLREDKGVWVRYLWYLTIWPGLKLQASLCSQPIRPSEWDLELKLQSSAHIPTRARRLKPEMPPKPKRMQQQRWEGQLNGRPRLLQGEANRRQQAAPRSEYYEPDVLAPPEEFADWKQGARTVSPEWRPGACSRDVSDDEWDGLTDAELAEKLQFEEMQLRG